MDIEELKSDLRKLNKFIYFDHNDYLREKCSNENLLKEIIRKFETAPTIDKLFLYGNLGNLYRIFGNSQRAIECLEKAVELSNGNKQIGNLIRLGEALKYGGQPEKALKQFNQAIDFCMSNTNFVYLDFAYQHKAKCLLELGQVNIALSYFQKAMKLRIIKGDQSLIDSTQKAIDYIEKTEEI